jgi:hypothetical protein
MCKLKKSDKVFHYTSLVKLNSIHQTQQLKVSNANEATGWRPCVSFTKSEEWEICSTTRLEDPGNGNIIFLSLQEHNRCFGMARIAIDLSDKLVSWRKYKGLSNIDLDDFLRVQLNAEHEGSDPAEDWFCCLEDVGSEHWLSIEAFVDGKWIDIWDDIEENGVSCLAEQFPDIDFHRGLN